MSSVKTEYGVMKAGVGVVALASSDERAWAAVAILRELLPGSAYGVSCCATSANRRYSRLIDFDHKINLEEHWIAWWGGEVLHYIQDMEMKKKSIARLGLWEKVRKLVL